MWISVEDSMPPDDAYIVAHFGFDGVMVGQVDYDLFVSKGNEYRKLKTMDHWMLESTLVELIPERKETT